MLASYTKTLNNLMRTSKVVRYFTLKGNSHSYRLSNRNTEDQLGEAFSCLIMTLSFNSSLRHHDFIDRIKCKANTVLTDCFLGVIST